jgi:hypothetical protein
MRLHPPPGLSPESQRERHAAESRLDRNPFQGAVKSLGSTSRTLCRMVLLMAATSPRVERIVSLLEELTTDEREELAERLDAAKTPETARSRVAAAVRRVVKDHREVLSALAK